MATSLYSLGLSQGRDVGISDSSNEGCPLDLSHFQSGLLYSLRGPILALPSFFFFFRGLILALPCFLRGPILDFPCPMTMSVCF
jgi:hypothetical protein